LQRSGKTAKKTCAGLKLLAKDGLWRAQDEAGDKGSVRVVHEHDDPSKRIVVTPVLRVISCEPHWWPEAPMRNEGAAAPVV
jgi:hypothetical protein